jgi:hypothetical protein
MQVEAASAPDGLSKTYLMGERAMLRKFYETIQPAELQWSIYSCADAECGRAAVNPPINDPAFTYWTTITDWQSVGMVTSMQFDVLPYGSAHPSTWNAVFCDGSVHAMSYNISLTTHQALSTRASGDSPDPSEY